MPAHFFSGHVFQGVRQVMAEYWVKPNPGAEAEGPLTGIEVKRRAAAEEISRDALISTDQTTWHPAGRVKGLFPVVELEIESTPAELPPPRPHRPVRRVGLPPAYPGAAPTAFGRAPAAQPLAPSPRSSAPVAQPPPPSTERFNDSPPPASPEVDEDVTAEPAPAPAAPSRMPPPPPVLPPSLGYATPGVTGAANIRPRKTGAFLVIALLMLIAGLVHAYEMYVSFTRSSPPASDVMLLIGSNLAWLCLAVAAVALWAMWLAGVHRDIQLLTAGQYRVSPAKAVGFLFIPIFNAFWAVFAPAKLASAVNLQLEGNGLPLISRGRVIACQIISVLAPLVGLYALTPLMYAISMRTIQSGFNRMVAQQYAT